MASLMEHEDDTSDQLEIVNGSKVYFVSGRKFRSAIPYFDNLFSANMLESNENKVTINLDSEGFDSIFNWVLTGFTCINMENVFPIYHTADYLMIDQLRDGCETLFQDKFTLNDLTSLAKFITPNNQLFTIDQINFFLAADLFKIAISTMLNSLPFETYKFLFKLKVAYSRQSTLCLLLQRCLSTEKTSDLETRKTFWKETVGSIRFEYISKEQLIQLVKTKPMDLWIKEKTVTYDLPPRGIQRSYLHTEVAVHEIDNTHISISCRLVGKDWVPLGVFTLDTNLSLSLLRGDDDTYDIIYDSGRQGIRINIKSKSYRYHEMIGTAKSYYAQKHQYILKSLNIKCNVFAKHLGPGHFYPSLIAPDPRISSILDSSNSYLVIKPESFKICFTDPDDGKKWSTSQFTNHLLHATIVADKTYILTNNFTLIQVNRLPPHIVRFNGKLDHEISFEDVILTSYDFCKLSLIDKRTKEIYIFDESLKKWTFHERMIISKPLIAITTVIMKKL